MKKTIIAAALFMAGASMLPATIVSVFNIQSGDTTTDTPIVDSGGNLIPLGGGVVAVGRALGGTVDVADLASTFDQFGSASNINGGGFGIDGFVSDAAPTFQVATATATADGFIGETVFVVIGNAADLASSTEFAVFQAAGTFLPDNLGLEQNTNVSLQVGGATQIFGDIASDVLVPGTPLGDLTFSSGIQLAGIPEPSSALLLGLGGLGFLIRRRR